MSKNPNGIFNMFKKIQKSPVRNTPKVSIETQMHNGVISWIDVQDPKLSDLAEIADDHQLHAVQVSQTLQKGQLAQMAVEENYVFLILLFPYLVTEENRIATSQVSVFLGKDFLVTVHDSATPSIRTLFNDYRDDESSETKSTGRILFHIIETLLKDVERLIQNVSIELDDIEDNVFDARESDALKIGQLRQKIMRLRRTLATQKNILDELDAVIDTFTDEHLERYYEINTNVSRKLWETVEEARETIEIYKDADFTTSTERTNSILAVLTLLFTLTIPATVLGTFYGMNVLVPGGLTSGSWKFLGEYTTLEVIIIVSFVSAAGMYAYFRKKRWF